MKGGKEHHVTLDRLPVLRFAASEEFYYYCHSTEETTWEKPANYKMAADDELMNAVIKIQCMFRAKKGREHMAEVIDAQLGGTWEVFTDEASGDLYYYNHITGETTWDMPQGYNTESSEKARANITAETLAKGGMSKEKREKILESVQNHSHSPPPALKNTISILSKASNDSKAKVYAY